VNRSPIGRALPLACAMLAGACTWAGAPVAEGPPAPVRAASASIVSAPPGPAHPARRVHPASAASAASAAFAAFVAPVASVAPVAAIAPVAPVEPHARERPGGGLRCASATAVLDGDSVVVRTQDGETLQVRIAAIDAPERGQPLADEARAHLAERVLQRALTLRTHERDRYGRTVADLWAGAPLAPSGSRRSNPATRGTSAGMRRSSRPNAAAPTKRPSGGRAPRTRGSGATATRPRPGSGAR